VLAVLLALSLQLGGTQRSVLSSPEKWVTGAFQSDAEATNFSAHAAWSLAMPLAGQAIDGRRGLWTFGLSWMGYSLAHEFLLHGPESARERHLNLISRLGPCALVLIIDAIAHR
jgi:hypothetical protein